MLRNNAAYKSYAKGDTKGQRPSYLPLVDTLPDGSVRIVHGEVFCRVAVDGLLCPNTRKFASHSSLTAHVRKVHGIMVNDKKAGTRTVTDHASNHLAWYKAILQLRHNPRAPISPAPPLPTPRPTPPTDTTDTTDTEDTMIDKLVPEDPRAPRHTATIRGKAYAYIVADPPAHCTPTGTILLIHGFPDLGFGWRYQVPLLASELGLRVIVPDMLGYGGTDAPHDPAPYAIQSVCADLVALVDHVGVVGDPDGQGHFFVGGHDWGGAVTWRMVLWHGQRLRGVVSVCTPFFAPAPGEYQPTEVMVQRLPNFRYQLQFRGDELWQTVDRDPARLRAFLSALYGGQVPKDKLQEGQSPRVFDTATGVDLARFLDVGPTPLLTPAEMDFYVAEYARHGLRGPTNWYRTGHRNWADERPLVEAGAAHGDHKIALPTLMLIAQSDTALPPSMSARMDAHFTDLTKRELPGTHWVLWQSAEAVNQELKAFFEPLLGEDSKASL